MLPASKLPHSIGEREIIMGWKFWKREDNGVLSKLPKPFGIPQFIGKYIVVSEKKDPDWVWSLKCALQPHAGSKTHFNFRIFNPALVQQMGVRIDNFESLDSHPELILYRGWYDKSSNKMEIHADEKVA